MQDGRANPKVPRNPSSVAPDDVLLNMVSISRPYGLGDIAGTWVIDPEIQVISSSTDPCPWNLHLSTTGPGSINVSVWVVPITTKTPSSRKIKRGRNTARDRRETWIDLRSEDSICLDLREASPGARRRPFHISLEGGPVTLSLPRSFRGSLLEVHLQHGITYANAWDYVEFSQGIMANLTPSIKEDPNRTTLLGNFIFKKWKGFESVDDSVGDRLKVIVKKGGRLKMRYEDEEEPVPEGRLDERGESKSEGRSLDDKEAELEETQRKTKRKK